ncbi:NAD(P)/FAD-dependent oxidoreductase [Kineosporia sp. A_224]|uniref:NAD(P)/FAD-dependent oxidoreductase n=1 Tax=Kineosporia sp. A_224 TaxID=1962180 RepID=UPI0013042651|nr:NAD(P)/FAD-dependent oxidoreductase [Kineosporia sp. A_224]
MIVVGARVAGAATAMLMARAGLRVLLLDRARFPSDAVSSHQVQVPGVALLEQWGVLAPLLAAGTPPAHRAEFDLDGVLLAADFPSLGTVGAVCSPRRYLLDAALVEAARAAGAEVREGFTVTGLQRSGGRVVGVVGHGRSGAAAREDAALVVGADGKHSTVAALVGARSYRTRSPQTFASYAYWSGVDLGGTARLYTRPGLAAAAFPTNDGLSVVFLSQPRQGFEQYRRDVRAGLAAAASRAGDLGERLRGARIVERIRTTPDLPHRLTTPCGPGWALAGDAAAVMDPVTAQGITHALRDADRLARAVIGAGHDRDRLAAALRSAWRDRDRALRGVFDGTARLAALAPLNRAQRALLSVVADDPDRAAAFVAAFTGTAPWQDSMTPWGAVRGIGATGLIRAAGHLRDPGPPRVGGPRRRAS